MSLLKSSSKLDLLLLPYEILDNILFYLESSEIIQLLIASKSIQAFLSGSYHIITDEVKRFASKVPDGFYTDIKEFNFEVLDHRKTLLLEIYDIRRSMEHFRNMIELLPMKFSCKISKHVNQPLLGDSKFIETIQRAVNDRKVVKSIQIVDSTSFQLHNSDLDISLISLPKARTLLLSDCYVKPHDGFKIKIPNLVNLYIDQGIHEVFESVELPLNVSLFGVSSENAVIENLQSSVLEDLRIESSRISSISNCFFPNLKVFVSHFTSIGKIVDLSAPNLKSFTINSRHSSFLWKNILLSNLQDLTVVCDSIDSECSNLYCPNLKEATIDLFNQPKCITDDGTKKPGQFRFLMDVEKLTIGGGCTHILEGLEFSKLTTLEIGNTGPTVKISKDVKFPALERLIIRGNRDITDIPELNAPLLSTMELAGASIDVKKLDLNHFKHLRSMTFNLRKSLVLTSVSSLNLKELIVYFEDNTEQVRFSDCQFSFLETLKILKGSSKRSYSQFTESMDQFKVCEFDQFSAPELVVLELETLDFKHRIPVGGTQLSKMKFRI